LLREKERTGSLAVRISGRGIVWALSVLAFLGIAPAASPRHAAAARAPDDLAQYVNPFSGTDAGAPDFGTGGGAANTFPGATLPFGMVQWSPDTVPGVLNGPGGYSYPDKAIRGFSLTHLSGAGCGVYQDVPFLPHVGPISQSPARFGSSDSNYTASFSHADEEASPGYYRVRLDPGTAQAVNSELTVTTRSGFGHFTYPATRVSSMIINAGGSAMADKAATVTIDPSANEVSGSATSGHFCFQNDWYTVYFAAVFNHPFAGYGTWQRQTLNPGSTSSSDTGVLPYNCGPSIFSACPQQNPSGTAQAGAYVSFDTTADRVIEVRVGISFTSVAEARRNLAAENPGWDFAATRAAAVAAWNRQLKRIEVTGGSLEDERTLYTTLYHLLLHPNVYSDADGQYVGMDGVVHTASGYTQYANYSGWDIYRTQTPLLALLEPQRTSDMMQSLVADEEQGGWLPKWSVASGQTDVMVGDPADPIIAGAYAFGATHFDTHAALQAMLKGATTYGIKPDDRYVERQALPEYELLGYVPQEENQGNVATFFSTTFVWASTATTLEYTTADFAVARMAGALCDGSTYETFMRRSGNWRNLLNPATGYLQPRYASGLFDPSFTPTSGNSYAEGDGAQYTWMVPYDIGGLVSALGGSTTVASRLDRFFTKLNGGPTSPYAFLGNEPSLETPWEYDWIGQPQKTQATVRRALLTLYNASPSGYPGNDDLGTMSSWWVFGALGLYPEIPGAGLLALGSPLFPHTVVHLDGGDLVIDAPAASDVTPYVRSMSVNGASYNRPWLSVSSLLNGARLDFALGSSPDPSWGSAPDDAPPSFAPDTPMSSVCRAAGSPAGAASQPTVAASGAGLPNTGFAAGGDSTAVMTLAAVAAGAGSLRRRRRR